MARSSGGISAIFPWTSASPSARSAAGSRFEAVFRSRALSCIAARSSSVQTLAEVLALRLFAVLALVAAIADLLPESSMGRWVVRMRVDERPGNSLRPSALRGHDG